MSSATEPNDFSENRVLLQIQACRKEQSRSFWVDLLLVLLIVLIAILGVLPFFLIKNLGLTLDFLYDSAVIIIALAYYTVQYAIVFPQLIIIKCLLFSPFIFLVFYWLGCLKTFRQQEFLSILQTSMETQTPLGQMVRAYAATKSGGYQDQLTGFANCIDRGLTLPQALDVHRGLLRYDVLGMLVVGTGDKEKEMMDTLEQMKFDHGIPNVFVSNTITRLIYLGVIYLQMLLVTSFLMLWILPQFVKIFDDFGLRLPAMTRLFIDA
ncbi:MAG: hypothetical protein FWC50_15115, partial [Planctomycetaceae bacterium]|nr:hypothetical protein [Planctomycetaceae bacterium]